MEAFDYSRMPQRPPQPQPLSWCATAAASTSFLAFPAEMPYWVRLPSCVFLLPQQLPSFFKLFCCNSSISLEMVGGLLDSVCPTPSSLACSTTAAALKPFDSAHTYENQ
eukprot:gnl/TRDRNA2_/TRDRNA2_152412_c1_seq1.p1 gnl/TRDRNA2_/TRDRNA2_152412_c1~~gnl/TRDRNA2_/TRDRNA2_152412_c1_seq1.p1  ORF type:complete len:109 (+),score=5.97 gnl/TRDRNA2_/TRDRNA2_152412_c1_seq1:229-555(+)